MKAKPRSLSYVLRAAIVASAFSVAVSAAEPDPAHYAKIEKIPYVGDETSLVRVKANPEAYVGRTFVICGGLKLADQYMDSYYGDRREQFAAFDLWELAADGTVMRGGNFAHLYLAKARGADVIARVAKMEEATNTSGKRSAGLVRVKVTINADACNDAKKWGLVNWRTMEILDVQSIAKDFKTWEPWIVEQNERKAQQRREQEFQAVRQRAAAAEAAELERQRAAEAAKWRRWTRADGEDIGMAMFRGAIAGVVKLETRDGAVLKIPLDELAAADRDWIKARGKTKSAAADKPPRQGAQKPPPRPSGQNLNKRFNHGGP